MSDVSDPAPSSARRPDESSLKWYQGIGRYQWLVLTIASLGWIFDVFEGQIFVASMRDAMPSLLGVGADDPSVSKWVDFTFSFFLLGGALGGVLFGMLSDRIGRSKTLIITILFYSLFTCVSAFAQEAWHMAVLRFLVAMGVGGEWAVASAMVAEVMPKRSRPVMGSIFHASSVFGTLLATATIYLLIGNASMNAWLIEQGIVPWRLAFFVGVVPALLTVWIRWKLHEPESWKAAKERTKTDPTQQSGRIQELFYRVNVRNTLVGVLLATIGLATFWGCHIYGKNALLRKAEATALVAEAVPEDAPAEVKQAALAKHRSAIKSAEMTSMALNTIGGGLGLVLFGSISTRLGRKGAFVFYHVIAFVVALLMFRFLPLDAMPTWMVACFLPVFGFFTLGMHAGYAVYFPELYPTRLRGTGAGFCFNIGRLGAAAIFAAIGRLGLGDEVKALWMAPLYLLGVLVVLFARETRDAELPE